MGMLILLLLDDLLNIVAFFSGAKLSLALSTKLDV